MKTTLILFALLCMFSSRAAIITVSNNSDSPGQYTNLQTALDASNPGDTLYVHGSVTNYGTIYIRKAYLTLIGTGYNPSKQNPLVSSVHQISFDTVQFISGGRDCKIYGFNVTGSVNGFSGAKNIRLERCKFGAIVGVSASNWMFIRNIFYGGLNLSNFNNMIVSNNIFAGVNTGIYGSTSSSVLISNNLFISPQGTFGAAFYSFENATIQNNIFFKGDISIPAPFIQNNTFNNNIAYLGNPDNVLPPAGNTGSGNLGAANTVGIDPKFVFVPLSATTYDVTHDYHLMATSPGHNAGTDGTDMGIYGGSYPWADMTGSPVLPQVKQFNVLTPSVNAGTPINISVKAKNQQ